jgi:hypothetical protein
VNTESPTWNDSEYITSAAALPDTFIRQRIMHKPGFVQAATRAFHPLNSYWRNRNMLVLADCTARLTGQMRLELFRPLESDYTHALP